MDFTTEEILASKLDVMSSSYNMKGEITSLILRIKRAVPSGEPNPNTGIIYKDLEEKLMDMWKFFNLDIPLTYYCNDEDLIRENTRAHIDIDRVIGSITSINASQCHVVLNEQGIRMVKAGLITPETRINFYYLVQGSQVYMAIKPYIYFPISTYNVTNAYKNSTKEEPKDDGLGSAGNDYENQYEGSSIQCAAEAAGSAGGELRESLPPEECPVHDGPNVGSVAAGNSGREAGPTDGNC